MIKAIIFDCFGVLTTQGLEAFYEDYFKDSPQKLAEAKKLIGQLNIGQLEHDDYIHKISSLSGVPEQSARDYLEDNKPNRPLLNYINMQLKNKYKIAMLSNAQSGWMKKLLSPSDLALFDDIVLSGDVGIAKPNPDVYELAASRLGLKPDACVFVDDLVHYAQAAQQAGMKAIHYRNFDQMKTELEQILTADSNH